MVLNNIKKPLTFHLFVLAVVIGTLMGWTWNWLHYNLGPVPAWCFGKGEIVGITILCIPLEDWLFYPNSGSFFIILAETDFICWPWRKRHPPFKLMLKHNNLKIVVTIILSILTLFGTLYFGTSGRLTVCFFGIPGLIMICYTWNDWHINHFLRTGAIIVSTNFIWEIWATPLTNQWYYNESSFLFSDIFWYAGIPLEMTPFLGFMSWPFAFGLIMCLKKFYYKTKIVAMF